MEWITDWLFGWFYDILYALQKSICVILDFIVEVFRKLAGIETVSINGKQEDLLSHFMLSNGVKTAFLGVLLIGVILLTVFTIISVLRSESLDVQHKKSKGQILTKSGQAFLIFLVIPFLILAGLMLSGAIMNAIDQSMTLAATNGVGKSTIGGQILVTSGSGAYTGRSSERAYIEQSFINGTLDYTNLKTVKKYYDLSELNFFVGIGSGFVILVMFVIAAIMFIARIFDIILLYIISPVSTATIPLDDGGRFRIWREMLISKILGAYGIILSMNIFFLIVPQINNIRFFANSFQNGIVSLLFIIGGAFSVTKANMVIAQLTGNNAGAQEAQQMMSHIHTSVRMVRMTSATVGTIGGRLFGGSDYAANKKKGASLIENVNASMKGTRNQTIQNESATQNRAATQGKATTQNGATTQSGTTTQKGANTQNGANTQKGTTTQNELSNQDTAQDMAGRVAKGTIRLATMPIGMLKDFAQGGLVTVGKNFIPRAKNVFTGSTITNRAEVKGHENTASTEGNNTNSEGKK